MVLFGIDCLVLAFLAKFGFRWDNGRPHGGSRHVSVCNREETVDHGHVIHAVR